MIAVSDSVVKYITDHYKTVHHKILSGFIEALTLLLFRITTNPQHSGLTKSLTTFPNSRINLLCLPGRITRLKGHESLIELMQQLHSQYPQLHAVIVGGLM